MKLSKANITKILINAGYTMSENMQTGRKFVVGSKTRTISMSSEGFTVRVINMDRRVDVYVTYNFSTFAHVNAAQFARANALEAQAMALLATYFEVKQDRMGDYLTQAK